MDWVEIRRQELDDLRATIKRAEDVVVVARKEERERCWKIAHDRADICERAAKMHANQKPNEPHWAASERCARHEAALIAREIRALDAKPGDQATSRPAATHPTRR